jgi:hypothetical protein
MGLTKQILLPQVPDTVIRAVYDSISTNKNEAFDDNKDIQQELPNYVWVRSNDIVQTWCKNNISPDIYWAVQVIKEHTPIHKDVNTESKFIYVIDTGGDNAVTHYYNEDYEIIESQIYEANKWYILNTKILHRVENITGTRIAITGRIHP